MFPLALFSMPGPFEMFMLAGLGLLFFGKRLPDVGRSIGQTVVQFKKGLNEVNDEIAKASVAPDPTPTPTLPDQSGYKFDPHTGEPIKR